MAGIDRHTGKVIGRAESIRQSIDIILRTPQGTRVMRREFGLACLHEDGTPRSGLVGSVVAEEARQALETWEPRCSFLAVSALLDATDELIAINVTYRDTEAADAEPQTTQVLFRK
jgi:hypothetical protein